MSGEAGQQGWQTWETVFTNSKAGMDGVDRDKVKRIVWDMSQGTPHFMREQQRQQQLDAKIAKMKLQAESLTTTELAQHTRAADSLLMQLEASRDLTRNWLHLDMDAFFASVEELDSPALRNVPMAVGGIGMISTANYAARRYGVRSAMPGYIGLKLCPQLVFVPCNFTKYVAASKKVEQVLKHFDSKLTSMSLDEAYLDITEYCALHGRTGAEVAEELRAAVQAETHLTCSVGVAPNRMLAKVCSDLRKPNGQYVLPNDRSAVMKFIETLPVRKVPGIGKVTEQMLSALGVNTCKDLVDKRGLLRALFSVVSSEFFLAAGLGLGSTSHSEAPAEGEVGRKGIGCERTFRATSNREVLETKVRELCASLVEDMGREGIKGRTLTLKLKTSAFEVRTRATSLGTYTSDVSVIEAAAIRLLRVELPLELRLLGVRMSQFLQSAVPAGQQRLDAFVRKPQQQPRQQDQGQHQQAHVQPDAQAPCTGDGCGKVATQKWTHVPQGRLGSCASGSQQHAGTTVGAAACDEGNSSPVHESLGDWVTGVDGTQLELSLRHWDPGSAAQVPGPAASTLKEAVRRTPERPESQQAANSWACTFCTFAHNLSGLPYCEVCGKFRRRLWDVEEGAAGPSLHKDHQAGVGQSSMPAVLKALTGSRRTKATADAVFDGCSTGVAADTSPQAFMFSRPSSNATVSTFAVEGTVGASKALDEHSMHAHKHFNKTPAVEGIDGQRMHACDGSIPASGTQPLPHNGAARRCGICGNMVEAGMWVEHGDWHLAMCMQHEQDGGAAGSAVGAAGLTRRRAKRQRTLTLKDFVKHR